MGVIYKIVNKDYVLGRPKYIDNNGCWISLGCINTNRYPIVKLKVFGGKIYLNRLVAHIYHNLDLTDTNQKALHKCDEPKCFNPEHIYVGSVQDNHNDMISRGRHINQTKTHCPKGHLLDSSFTLRKGGNIRRHCSICTNLSHKKSYANKKIGVI